MRSGDIFAGTEHQKPKRKAPRVMAHVADAGAEAIRFECDRCGWDSDWLVNNFTPSEAKRGIPCEMCNT